MSKKGIFVALSLAMAQLCSPMVHTAIAQTVPPSPADTSEITFLEGLAHKLNVAIGRAIILGQHDPEGANKTAAAIGVRAFSPFYIEQVLNADTLVRKEPETLKKSALARDIFSLKRNDTAINERSIAAYAIELLAADVSAHPEVASYCARRNSELCDAFGLVRSRVPPALDND